MAGQELSVATIGFCISGVGLPLLGILAMAMKHSDNPDDMAMSMHPMYARAITILCALTIGPLFAIPRTALFPLKPVSLAFDARRFCNNRSCCLFYSFLRNYLLSFYASF